MRKIILSVLLVLLLVSLCGYIFLTAFGKIRPGAGKQSQKSQQNGKPERVGEKIVYDVRLGKLNIGRAVFNHLSMTEYNGKKARLITFETRVVRFTDLERIYSDAETSLPLRVERSISTWPFPEKITEDYDQSKFTVTIKKTKRGRQEESVIKKDNVINNAILLPYYVRDMDNLRVGYNFIARLPTQEFVIEMAGEEEITIPAGKFKAYRFTSKPKKFEIWISSDSRRIPLKIKGANGLGYTLFMREYSL